MDTGLTRRTLLRAGGAAGLIAAAAAAPAWAAPAGNGLAECARRADLAQNAALARHVRPLWGVPGVELGMPWPAGPLENLFVNWDYWFQAHLLDCAVDAALRAPAPDRRERVGAIARAIWARNVVAGVTGQPDSKGWANRYYDDMSWLLIALNRAERGLGMSVPGSIAELQAALHRGWDPAVGAFRWRIGSGFFNAPTNGPAGIALTRLGDVQRGTMAASFLHNRLRDKATGLIYDGVNEPGARYERTIYTYCQGVTIGLETELARSTKNPEHRSRATALIKATRAGCTRDDVIAGRGGGDGGLFMGILARYLAYAAVHLKDATAARIVHTSAQAAWDHRKDVDGLPLFGTEWSRPVQVPAPPENPWQLPDGKSDASKDPVRGLSVQLSGWMVLEADYLVTAAGM